MSDTTVLIRIVDDDEEFAASQKMLIESLGWEVVTYSSATEFLAEDALERPGCLILDVRMPVMTGLELQQELEKRACPLPIIFLSAHGNIGLAVDTLKRGARDFYEKPVAPEILRETVARLVQENLQCRKKKYETHTLREQYESLTNRERVILKLVAQNLSNKAIADQLQIQEHTVKIHRGNACHKLNIRTVLDVHHFLSRIGEI